MNILFLNLPFTHRLMRRYICSFNAPNFLFPPQEILYLATAENNKNRNKTFFLDAIAESYDFDDISHYIKHHQINCIVAMTGFESIEYELQFVDKLKQQFPDLKLILFGYYASYFYHEILTHSSVDIIILNEPDETCSELLGLISQAKENIYSIIGIAFKIYNQVINTGNRPRIKELDNLSIPDHSLLNRKAYYEPLFPKPYTTIQMSRGCPFACNYCVRSYGREFYFRSPEHVLKEIIFCYEELNIRYFRFIDDTFTVNRTNVITIVQLILKNKLNIAWTCLCRLDTIDEELYDYLWAGGCKRIFFGIESGAQHIIDYYQKGYKLVELINKLKFLKKHPIELAGYFIVGNNFETYNDLNQSIQLSIKLDLDFVMVSKLFYYPGTKLFQENQAKIKFTLFPKYEYENQCYMNDHIFLQWEKEFYKRFYFRWVYIKKWINKFFLNPFQIIANFCLLSSYIVLKPKPNHRDDFF